MSDLTADAIDRITELTPEPTQPLNMRKVEIGRRQALIGLVRDSEGAWYYAHEDITPDEHELERPLQPTGVLVANDVTGFLTLVEKHATPKAEIYADETSGQIIAVLDGGAPWAEAGSPTERAAWGDHRVVVHLQKDDDWQAWEAIDGRLLSTSQMADHLETYRHTIATPDAAEVLEVARSIEVVSESRFKVGPVSTGHRSFVVSDGEVATAGRDTNLTIPTELTLRLRPYAEGGRVSVRALFRYRIERGELRLGVKLLQLADVRAAAWSTVVADIRTGIDAMDRDGIRVVNGKAPARRR